MGAASNFVCAYCGAKQYWSGPGAAVCGQCGAAQPRQAPLMAILPRRRGRLLFRLVLLGLVAGAAVFGWRHYSRPPVVATPVVAAAKPPVIDSRIRHVDNPPIRLLPKDVKFTAEDLLDSVEDAPPFDAHLLVVKTPRRMADEDENTVFLGEVTNTSPNQTAIAPVATMTLTRNGQTVESAEHEFPDLAPGAHVPVYFRYDGDPRSFDAMVFTWKPTQSYAVGAARYPKLVATVGKHELGRGEDSDFDRVYHYVYQRVTGTIVNNGEGAAKNIRLYVILRDSKGDITGYDRDEVGTRLEPGESTDFDVNATQWGGPVASVEAVALPTSPPPLAP
jgi:hypothetical protein